MIQIPETYIYWNINSMKVATKSVLFASASPVPATRQVISKYLWNE